MVIPQRACGKSVNRKKEKNKLTILFLLSTKIDKHGSYNWSILTLVFNSLSSPFRLHARGAALLHKASPQTTCNYLI